MSDRIATALARLNARLKARASSTFTYRRGLLSVALSVTTETPVLSPLTVLAAAVSDRDLSQPSPKHVDHDFSFPAADLVLNGVLTEPANGDTIEMTAGGVTTVYRLSPTLDGQLAWKYATGYESGAAARILIHARLASVT